MGKFIRQYLTFLLLFISSIVWAGNISSPPVLKDIPESQQSYFKELSDEWNNLEVFSTRPQDSNKGDIWLNDTKSPPCLEFKLNGVSYELCGTAVTTDKILKVNASDKILLVDGSSFLLKAQ